MAHAFCSPSGAPAWSRCHVKPWRELPYPSTSSDAADEGTAAHFLLEQCLLQGKEAKHFSGLRIKVTNGATEFHTGGQYPVGPEMTGEIQKVLDYIHRVADGARVHAELNLSIAHITREYVHIVSGAVVHQNANGEFVDVLTGEVYLEDEVEPATGTTDVTIIAGSKAHIIDLKYGKGVQVFAPGNEQLGMYADGALLELDLLDEVEEVTLHIAQPRMNHWDEETITRAELTQRMGDLRRTSQLIFGAPKGEGLTATPGDKQCKFCADKANCAEYSAQVLGSVVDGFVDLDRGFVQVSMDQAEKLLAQAFGVKPAAITFEAPSDGYAGFTVKKPNIRPELEAAEAKLPDASDERLATLMDAADMIEGFARAVRAEVERRLLAGKFTDARYKLVEGRQGNRAWKDPEAAEAAMKAMRLKVDQMYDFSIISPTKAETLLAAANPRKWKKLVDLIGRADGKPSVAPASDKRPPLSVTVAEHFEELPPEETQAPGEFDDLV